MNLLHISFAKSWRGGENQVIILTEQLQKLGHNVFCAFVANSELSLKIEESHLFKLFSHPLMCLIQWAHLMRFIKRNQIQILHSHCSKSHNLGLLIKLFRPHLKLIVHRRVAFNKKLNKLEKWKYQTPLVDAYIAISQAVKEDLKTFYGVDVDKIHVFPSSVDFEKFNHDKTQGRNYISSLLSSRSIKIDESSIIVGTASALTSEKGLMDFVEALRKIKNPHLIITLAGDGRLKGSLEKSIHSTSWPFPILLLGFCENMPLYLAGLDVLVIPSHKEGLGSVALESIASKTLVVSSDAGGLKEIVINLETGLSFPSSNIEKLAQQIDLAIENIELRQQLTKKAFDFIRQKYNVENMVLSTHQLYNHVLKASPTGELN
jgi:glycosyltransferase involved in cell wall biosynthesis